MTSARVFQLFEMRMESKNKRYCGEARFSADVNGSSRTDLKDK